MLDSPWKWITVIVVGAWLVRWLTGWSLDVPEWPFILGAAGIIWPLGFVCLQVYAKRRGRMTPAQELLTTPLNQVIAGVAGSIIIAFFLAFAFAGLLGVISVPYEGRYDF